MKALEDSELYCFPVDLNFEDLLQMNVGLVKNLLYSQSIKDFTYSYIYEMYESYQEKFFCPNITQSEMALLLNMHTVTFSNVIAQLKEKNVIETFTKKQLIITDLEKLCYYRFYGL